MHVSDLDLVDVLGKTCAFSVLILLGALGKIESLRKFDVRTETRREQDKDSSSSFMHEIHFTKAHCSFYSTAMVAIILSRKWITLVT